VTDIINVDIISESAQSVRPGLTAIKRVWRLWRWLWAQQGNTCRRLFAIKFRFILFTLCYLCYECTCQPAI